MARFKLTMTALMLLTGGVLIIAVAQRSSNADIRKADSENATVVSEADAPAIDEEEAGSDEREEEQPRDQRRDRRRSVEEEEERGRNEDDSGGESDREREDRDRPDREAEHRERQHRERIEREHEEFERHVTVMRREIEELARTGRKEQAEQRERELEQQLAEFRTRQSERQRDAEFHERMERVRHSVHLLQEAARNLAAAGLHDPAEEIADFSERIAHHGPRQLEERRHHDETRRHDQSEREDDERHNDECEHERRETVDILESHEDRIRHLENQLKDVRLFLEALQRDRERSDRNQ